MSKLISCPACGRPMDASRAVCVYCQQQGVTSPPAPTPDPLPVTAPVAPATPTAPPRNHGGGAVGGLISLALLGWWLIAAGVGPFSALRPLLNMGDAQWEVRVRTSPASKFSGTYMVVTGSGGSQSHTVDGLGGATYDAGKADIVSAVFQKGDDSPSTLTVEIHKNGQLYRQESTSAAYGVVQVADR